MKIILLPALALALVACRPPYDGDLSYTQALAGKMKLEATVGPVASSHDTSDSAEGVFLPLKTGTGVDAQRGFIVFTDSYGSILWYVEPNGSGGYLAIRNGNQGSSYNSDPLYPVFDCKPLKAGPYIAVIKCKTDDPLNNTLFQITADIPNTLFNTNPFDASTFNTTAGPRIMCSQIYPDTSTLTDRIFFLFWESANNGYREMQESIDGTAAPGVATDINSAAYNLSFLPYGITRCLYYRDPAAARSYASFYAGGAWRCWRWYENPSDPSNPFQSRLTGITTRIDALLTTGELFSTQDDMGRVYDSDGNLRADFHLGGLKFAFETYVNGIARVFFSQMYVTKEKIYFKLYSIETADLTDL